MSRLRVLVLGGLSVSLGFGPAVGIAGSCRPVVGYLIAHRQRTVSRIELAETLWADHDGDNARRCLSTALWRLKRSTPGPTPLLTFEGPDTVSFNWNAPAWVDAIAMEMRVAPLLRQKPSALTREDLARLERGVRLYRGDYLVGMEQEWAWIERQRLRTLYCDALYHLITAYAAGFDWSHVLEWGRQLNREEPLREDVHRLLMAAYANTGNRASAVAQYRECERQLARELGIEPMAETRELYQQLLFKQGSGTAPAAPPPSTISAEASRRIRRVRRVLRLSEGQLERALDSLGAGSKDSTKT